MFMHTGAVGAPSSLQGQGVQELCKQDDWLCTSAALALHDSGVRRNWPCSVMASASAPSIRLRTCGGRVEEGSPGGQHS